MAGVVVFDDLSGGGFGTFIWGDGTYATQNPLGLTDEATSVTSTFVVSRQDALGLTDESTGKSITLEILNSLGLTDETANAAKFLALENVETVGPIESVGFLRRLALIEGMAIEETFGGLPILSRSFTDDLGLEDDGDPDFLPGGDEDVVVMNSSTTFIRTLSIIDSAGLSDNFDVTRLYPTIGMSRPFTYDVGWRDIINKIELTTEKRYAYPEEVVWEEKSTKTVFPDNPVVYKVTTEDPFFNAVIPVPGLKSYSDAQQVVTPEDYDFLVESGTVAVQLSRTSGQSLDITVTALDNTPAVISNMTLRAQPVKVTSTLYVSAKDAPSQATEGVKTPSSEEQPPDLMNVNDSRAIMEIILNQRFKKLPFVSFTLNNGSVQRMRALLDLKLSDRVEVAEDETFTDNQFYVEQIAHSIDGAGTSHSTVVGCEQLPAPIEGAMIFDDPDLGFDVGVFGDRANTYDFDNNLFIVGQSSLNGNKVLGL